jgi:hypothetical protein
MTTTDSPGAGEPPDGPATAGASALVLPAGSAVDRLAAEVLAQLHGQLAFDRAAFIRVASQEEMEVVAIHPPGATGPPAGTRMAIEDVLGAAAVRMGFVVEVDTSESDLPFDRILAEQGFRYVLRAPLGEVPFAAAGVAVLRRESAFSTADVETVELVARAAGPAVMKLVLPAVR